MRRWPLLCALLCTLLSVLPSAQALRLSGGSGAGGGAITDGDKGDISVTGAGTVWTIDPNTITYTKLQSTTAPAVLLGRGASSAGPLQEIILGTNLSMSGTTLNAAGGGGGGVASVFGRTGSVSAQAGDYTAAQVTNAESSTNKDASATLGTSSTLYPTQGAVKGYVDTGLAGKQPTVTWGAGLSFGGSTAAVASTESGFLTNGGATPLTCGLGTAGRLQVLASGELQYCDGAGIPLLRTGLPTQAGLTWNVTASACTGDANGGKLTLHPSGTQIVCASDIGGTGGPGGVASVFGRTGAVVAQGGDYTAAQVTNAADRTTANTFTHASGQTMARLMLTGATSGAISLRPPAIAGTSIVVWPAGSIDFTTTGGPGHVLRQSSGGSAFTVSPLASPDLSDSTDLVRLTTAQKVSGKQNVPREVLYTPAGSPLQITPDCDTTDVVVVNTISAALTINDPVCTGTNPEPSQELTLRLFSSASRVLTWASGYSAEAGVPFPAATTGDGVTYDYLKFLRNSQTSKWDLVATRALEKGVTTKPTGATLQCNINTDRQCQMTNTAAAGTGILLDTPLGSPNDGDLLMVLLLCQNAQPLTHAAIFQASAEIPLPTSCAANLTQHMAMGYRYSSILSKYQLLSVNFGASGGGGGGSPGGSSAQGQYNNGGSFAGSSGLTLNGTSILTRNDAVTTVSTDTTLGAHNVVVATTGTGAVALTLPSAATTTVGQYVVVKGDDTLGELRVLPNGADLINGLNGFVSTQARASGFRLTRLSSTAWLAEPLNIPLRAEDLANGVTGTGFVVQQTSPVLLGGHHLEMTLTQNGHVEYKASVSPTVATGATDCGTSPVLTGNDVLGKVTVGTSTNGGKCTLTFANAWSQAPQCFCQNASAAQLCRGRNATTTTVELTGTLAAGDVVQWTCAANY